MYESRLIIKNTTILPGRDPGASNINDHQTFVRVQNALLNGANGLDQTFIKKKVPFDDFESIDASSPDSGVLEQRGRRSSNITV